MAKNQAPKEIEITDHARIRYLERVEGMDIKELDEKILPPKFKEYCERMGSKNFTFRLDNHRIIIVDGRLKTVLPKRDSFGKTKKRVQRRQPREFTH